MNDMKRRPYLLSCNLNAEAGESCKITNEYTFEHLVCLRGD
jgi:hypothetical protein